MSKDSLAATRNRCVVLVHGLGAHRLMMSLLARRIKKAQQPMSHCRTVLWGYASTRGRIERHAEDFARLLLRVVNDPLVGRVQIVAHSMGAIITRVALATTRLAKLDRVVMLGPPNLGSPVASRFAPRVGAFCPALEQLSDGRLSFVNRLAHDVPCEVGIVAAARDRVVPAANTTLDSQSDHVILDSGHNGLLVRRLVAERVNSFLERGSFHAGASAATVTSTSASALPRSQDDQQVARRRLVRTSAWLRRLRDTETGG